MEVPSFPFSVIMETSACSISDKCPVVDWEKCHPEYANDELATKIEILEAGGEEAYKAKLKAQEEAKKKAEEEKLKASDTDILNAARQLLKLYKSILSYVVRHPHLKLA